VTLWRHTCKVTIFKHLAFEN